MHMPTQLLHIQTLSCGSPNSLGSAPPALCFTNKRPEAPEGSEKGSSSPNVTLQVNATRTATLRCPGLRGVGVLFLDVTFAFFRGCLQDRSLVVHLIHVDSSHFDQLASGATLGTRQKLDSTCSCRRRLHWVGEKERSTDESLTNAPSLVTVPGVGGRG